MKTNKPPRGSGLCVAGWRPAFDRDIARRVRLDLGTRERPRSLDVLQLAPTDREHEEPWVARLEISASRGFLGAANLTRRDLVALIGELATIANLSPADLFEDASARERAPETTAEPPRMRAPAPARFCHAPTGRKRVAP